MFDFEEALKLISQQTVLCVGDLMLDDFVYGEVTRISPEAPTPVLAVARSELEIGGAGNVARNIAALGARCLFVGIIGKDAAAQTLLDALARLKAAIVPHLVVDETRHTTRKVRFVSEHHSAHLMRADWETARPISAETESAVITKAIAAMADVGAVVLSDYAKGVLTPRVTRAIIDRARQLGKPVIVDPKGHDYSVYQGATILTPNRQELGVAVHRPVATEAEIAKAAAELARIVDSDAVLVTRSEEGMTLHVEGHEALHIAAYPVKVRDVSGAGDTVAAVIAVLLAMKAPFDSAMRAANAAAAVVVGKRGTAAVSLAELRHRILPSASLAPEDKIVFDWSILDERIAEWRRHGLRIGFTNGCFDILHRGHTKLLAEARAACDRLVVGLNSDASTTRLKGKGRPINPAEGRAEVLAALEAVDLVVVFEEDTPLELIKRVRPTVLIKGADYKREDVVGRDVVEEAGGDVILVGLVPGHSTTAIVERAQPGKQSSADRK
ncbi:MAG TPA: D-glycero-beta-D-manno-heptose-7-phosphate kinase [Xanthobacteraceae bacterium]|jgi:D-beta-D-heptose 7-phosphate kinase/D-beta-D-heptose 1-phosphate adenosyltransferase|nr:D-glycero-beta-D-manno-heptose-7-phosphate kinase [Xanthobacteraceae bacterium]